MIPASTHRAQDAPSLPSCAQTGGRFLPRPPVDLHDQPQVGTDIPRLRWRYSEARLDPAVVERMGLSRAKRLGEVGARGGGTNSTPRIHTPEPFRDLLISIARTADKMRAEA